MKKHYECKPLPYDRFRGERALIFDWDDETGEISGRDKAYFEQFKPCGEIFYRHPIPGFCYSLGKEPFKSIKDMAAMIQYGYILPDDLKSFCPTWEPPEVPEGATIYY